MQAGLCAVGVYRQVATQSLKLLLQVCQTQQAPGTGNKNGLEVAQLGQAGVVRHDETYCCLLPLLLLLLVNPRTLLA